MVWLSAQKWPYFQTLEIAGNLKDPAVKCFAVRETASKVGMKEAFRIYGIISEPRWIIWNCGGLEALAYQGICSCI